MAQKISDEALEELKESEGWRSGPYWDEYGQVWTQGYGHTGPEIDANSPPWSPEKGHQVLLSDVAWAEKLVNGLQLNLTQGMFDALVDFAFNVGPGQKDVKDGLVLLKTGEPSTLLKKLVLRDYEGAANEFPKWVYAKGIQVPGLVKRRDRNRRRFLADGIPQPDLGDVTAPIPTLIPIAPPPASPRPDLEPSTTEHKPMSVPALLIPAAIEALRQLVPALGRMFSSGSPTAERNIKAAEMVIEAATRASGSVNTQEMIEKVTAPHQDPAVVENVKTAVTHTVEVYEVGGGIAAARQAATDNPDFIPIMRNVSYMAILFLLLANLLVGAMVVAHFQGHDASGWEQLLGIVLQADIGIAMIAVSFWLGSSLAKPRLQAEEMNQQQKR